ncbi:MAG: hypothetical protein KC431_07670 [Myxococcales bacterium]|nr:hypothetical protein [Myxococcales bacterium]
MVPDIGHRAVVKTLLGNTHWTLGQLAEVVNSGGPGARQLAGLTIGELRIAASGVELAEHQGAFEQALLAVLAAAGKPVAAGFLRARVGGRRWTLTGAMRRLERQGLVEISGRTSDRRYRLVQRD